MFERYDSVVKSFMSNCRTNKCTEETLKTYSNVFRFYREFLEKNEYDDACHTATTEWKEYLTSNDGKKSVSLRTLDMYLRILKYVSDYGVETCVYQAPFVIEKMFPPKKQVSKEKNKEYKHVLKIADMVALINAEKYTVKGHRTPRTFLREKAIVTMLLTSGMRNIEVRNLTLKNLNFGNSTIYCEITKGRKPRYVPFPVEAQKAVNAYLNSGLRPFELPFDAPLFGVLTDSGEWRKMERSELSDKISRYISGVIGDENASRSHALRHCFASTTLTDGTPMEAISQMLGHADMQTTRIYSQDLEPELSASNFANNVSNMLKEGAA